MDISEALALGGDDPAAGIEVDFTAVDAAGAEVRFDDGEMDVELDPSVVTALCAGLSKLTGVDGATALIQRLVALDDEPARAGVPAAGGVTDLEVRIAPSLMHPALDADRQRDGSALARLSVTAGPPELFHALARFGPRIEVVSPRSWRGALADLALAASEQLRRPPTEVPPQEPG